MAGPLNRENQRFGNCQMDMSNRSELKEFLSNNFTKSENFEEFDFLFSYGKLKDALLYSVLFMPDLIEIDSCILLKDRLQNEEILRKFKKEIEENPENKGAIEFNYNWIEIGYLFSTDPNFTEEYEKLLALKIRHSWTGWLTFNYPERKFIVKILTPDETGSTFGVGFFEDRS